MQDDARCCRCSSAACVNLVALYSQHLAWVNMRVEFSPQNKHKWLVAGSDIILIHNWTRDHSRRLCWDWKWNCWFARHCEADSKNWSSQIAKLAIWAYTHVRYSWLRRNFLCFCALTAVWCSVCHRSRAMGSKAVQTHLRWIQKLELTNCFVAPEVSLA